MGRFYVRLNILKSGTNRAAVVVVILLLDFEDRSMPPNKRFSLSSRQTFYTMFEISYEHSSI